MASSFASSLKNELSVDMGEDEITESYQSMPAFPTPTVTPSTNNQSKVYPKIVTSQINNSAEIEQTKEAS